MTTDTHATTVADSVRAMIAKIDAKPAPKDESRPATVWQRVWPAEFEPFMDNSKAIPLDPDKFFPNMCPNCGGTSIMLIYVISEGPFQHPVGKCKWLEVPRPGWYLGELKVAWCPVCKAGENRVYLERNSGLAGMDLYTSLETFSVKDAFSEKAPAIERARHLLGMNRQPAGFVTFTSEEYGVGKTHLLKALVNGFRHVDVMGRYITLPDLLQEIRDLFGEGDDKAEQLVQNYRKAKVLCLDEIDKVSLTGWAMQTIFRLLNSRYEERESLLTVMATNTLPENMPAELGYLASRMREGDVIAVAGPDVRAAKGAMRERKDLD
jgi:DNA replication protein DnaC